MACARIPSLEAFQLRNRCAGEETKCHAASLASTQNFSETLQAEDDFVHGYMRDIGHYGFSSVPPHFRADRQSTP
jgi:hypothetical protein